MQGGDAKYGRLFTEEDVCALLFARTGEPPETLREFVETAQGRFPADEPLFLIRGQDRAASDAIGRYADEAHAAGASDDMVRSALSRANEVEDWQKANPDRVKVPD